MGKSSFGLDELRACQQVARGSWLLEFRLWTLWHDNAGLGGRRSACSLLGELAKQKRNKPL